ncbi:hypothetical protein CI109_106371 [Kwoniella shandongensis]|uniref:Major facilitator superfamily (MFS) profile domain-containing protein n=1 Tax=Kwoniella shandongensis TaxID=1734106 RepID=A0AAJ8LM48_9TREE
MDPSQANEQTPLISPQAQQLVYDQTISDHPRSDPPPATSVPWSQVIPICLIHIAEASSFTCIFPFITEFLTAIDTPKDKIGLYGGIAEGCVQIIEAILAIFWAKMADRFGRKKCLILGFILPICSTTFLGFGKSVGWIIFWRAISGLNPAQTINRVILAEISNPSNRARIYPITDPAYTVGVILGTTIGGELSSPYHKLPRWLGGEVLLFRDYPYALPCLTTTVVGVIALLTSMILLKESKPLEVEARPGEQQQQSTVADTLKAPYYKTVLLVFCANMALFGGLYTVWGYTPVLDGGLGLPVEIIGRLSVIANLSFVFGAPFFVPIIQKRLGAKRGLLLTTGIIPVEVLGIPVVQWAATKGRKAIYETLWLEYGMTTLHAFSWPICHQFLVACFDDYPQLRATGMAVTLIAGAVGRATGPALAGWIYSYSTQFPTGSFGRQLSWLVIFWLVLPAVVLTSYIPRDLEKKAEGGHGSDEEEQVAGLLHSHDE